jgi:FixJ family two-component response regulator
MSCKAAPNMIPASPQKFSVHVVDDDASVRTAVSRLLSAAGYEANVYASAGEFALAQNESLTGCVLLDVRMPGPSGFDLQSSLARNANRLPIIFLTGHGDIPMSVRAMKAGAVDFLTKPVQPDELLAAVKSAVEGEAEERRRRMTLSSRAETLTEKEKEVFQRVTAGQPNKVIAAEMQIGERTAKAYRAQVMLKMHASSLAHLVQIAEEMRHLAI